MTEQTTLDCAPRATNVRLFNKHDRGYAMGMFSVDIVFPDGRAFPDALTVPVSSAGVQRTGGQCSPGWSDACHAEVVTPEEAKAAGAAALEAVGEAVGVWPLARTVRTLSRVEQPNEDGNFPVQWELTCPHCGAQDWDSVDERGSWGVLRCQNGHLSKVAIVEHNGEKLFTTVEAK